MNLTERSWQSSILKVMVGNELISETSLSPCMTCIVFDEWKQISIPNGLERVTQAFSWLRSSGLTTIPIDNLTRQSGQFILTTLRQAPMFA